MPLIRGFREANPWPQHHGHAASKRARRLVVLGGGAPTAAPARCGWSAPGPGDPGAADAQGAEGAAGRRRGGARRPGLRRRSSTWRRPRARRICVAKRKSRHSYAQDEINRLLVALALEGLTVVRLKGGDPVHLRPRRRGAGSLPRGRRRLPRRSRRHRRPGGRRRRPARRSPIAARPRRSPSSPATRPAGGEPDLDWASLARANQTVVIYMGLSTAAADRRAPDRRPAAPARPRR